MRGRTRKLLLGAGGAGAAAGGILLQKLFFSADRHAQRTEVHVASVKAGNGVRPARPLPSRREMLSRLRREPLDVLVVGGGATGAGCALDAASRGLRTGLVEADDFASGTSSRSTKLIHGGVRYLQKAIMSLDYEQYSMVKEALHERANLLDIAPHLSFPLPIMLPVYQSVLFRHPNVKIALSILKGQGFFFTCRWWKLPYYWAGIKAYDLVSGRECLKPSYYLNKDRALEVFPMLKSDKLKGAIVYYDGEPHYELLLLLRCTTLLRFSLFFFTGSHNDSRMRLSIAITAARYGAAIANHTRVMGLLKDQNGKVCCLSILITRPYHFPIEIPIKENYYYTCFQVCGANVRNELTGEEFPIQAKCVINATGPFVDSIRKMDNPEVKEIVCPSAGQPGLKKEGEKKSQAKQLLLPFPTFLPSRRARDPAGLLLPVQDGAAGPQHLGRARHLPLPVAGLHHRRHHGQPLRGDALPGAVGEGHTVHPRRSQALPHARHSR